MNSDTNMRGRPSTPSVTVGENECASCGRILKSSTEWIRGDQYIICEYCYRSILYPERNASNQENI